MYILYIHVYIYVHIHLRRFMCLFCGQGMSNSSNMNVHVRTHYNDEYACIICVRGGKHRYSMFTCISKHVLQLVHVCVMLLYVDG